MSMWQPRKYKNLLAMSNPNGNRTLRVSTEPDLVDEGTEPRVIELVEGRAKVMKPGWHAVRKPGQWHLSDDSWIANI